MRTSRRVESVPTPDKSDMREGIARACLRAVEDRSLSFAQVADALRADGFDGLLVDHRRWMVKFYHVEGQVVTLGLSGPQTAVAPAFDSDALRALVTTSSYTGGVDVSSRYRSKLLSLGCGGFLLSASRRSVTYMGLDGSTFIQPVVAFDGVGRR
jgi:hypothetical protein